MLLPVTVYLGFSHDIVGCCDVMCLTDDKSYRTFFHSPLMGARAVVSIGNYMPADVFTVCVWVRSNDGYGGLLTYSTPSKGMEWSLRVGDRSSGDTT